MLSDERPHDHSARIEALIERIRADEEELQHLTGGEIDAFVSHAGTAYLLPNAQAELLESRESARMTAATQRAILDALPAHVALVDHDGVIVSVNEAWRQFGRTNGSTDPNFGIGCDYFSVCVVRDDPSTLGSAEVAAGLRAVLDGSEDAVSVEYPCDAPNDARWFRATITPVLDSGEVKGAVVTHLNITERRLYIAELAAKEQALRESRTLQLAAERMARLGGWRYDVGTGTITWSDEVCRIHGIPLGSTPTVQEAGAFYAAEARETIYKQFARCGSEGIPFDFEAQVTAASGERRWVRSLGEAIRDETGAIVAVEGAMQDITEQKKMEAQFLRAQRMESVGTLAGGIAHDLNNVLTPVLMSVDLLRTSLDEQERHELLDGVEAATRRGADMVRQVLTFARGVEGQRIAVAVERVLREVRRICQETFPRNIDVRLHVDEALPSVLGDSTQIQQVLINLCVNARDAMPDGGVLTIAGNTRHVDAQYLSGGVEAAPGPYLVVTVGDTGIGMAPAILDRIFEPFFTTKEVGKGTGLGLSTSAAIVKSHRGFMRSYSEPGVGSQFRVYFPAASAADVVDVSDASEAIPRGNGELILVVDDETSVRTITRQSLETFGYRVVTATDGADALARYAEHRSEIALVLTDLMMPVMDGNALIEVITRMDPTVRIIAASGLHTHGPVLRALESRVKVFLEKPYTAENLLKTVRRVLDS
jgi:PAS domain S-box-containing protein